MFRTLLGSAFGLAAERLLGMARLLSHGRIDGMVGSVASSELKYGENPYQTSARLFVTRGNDAFSVADFKQRLGGPMGYVNWTDTDRMLHTMRLIMLMLQENFFIHFWGNRVAVAVGVKHGNPCGASVSFTDNREVVTQKMVSGDPLAIFGGAIALNFTVTESVAQELLCYGMEGGRKRLFDVVIAPDFTEKALLMLERNGGACKILSHPILASPETIRWRSMFRPVTGGFLTQPQAEPVEIFEPGLAEKVRLDLCLAWAIAATSNSNTVTLVKEGQLIGNGCGRTDRVGAAALAIEIARRGEHDVQGAVAASDGFFPFDDGPKLLADAGVAEVVAPSGSVRDEEIAERCREWEMRFHHLPRERRGFAWH